jgi:hypothetical protein
MNRFILYFAVPDKNCFNSKHMRSSSRLGFTRDCHVLHDETICKIADYVHVLQICCYSTLPYRSCRPCHCYVTWNIWDLVICLCACIIVYIAFVDILRHFALLASNWIAGQGQSAASCILEHFDQSASNCILGHFVKVSLKAFGALWLKCP